MTIVMISVTIMQVPYGIVQVPDSKVHGANMGPTWVLSAPDEPHVGPMNLAIEGHWNAFDDGVSVDFIIYSTITRVAVICTLA